MLIAAAYIGLGTTWHGGLSGSAPLILATPNNPLLSPAAGAPVIDRLVPITETLFTSFNLVYLVVVGGIASNMAFLAAALLLQGRPSHLVCAVTNGAPTTAGIILQFPFYAGIFGIINSTGLGVWLGDVFVRVATTETYPLIVYVYSGVMNLFGGVSISRLVPPSPASEGTSQGSALIR